MPTTLEPSPPRPSARPAWVRGLSLLGTVAFVVGNMVGTSVYTLPATLAREVGPLGIVAWVVAALGFLPVALVYASLGRRWPRTGGPYVYAREAFGEFVGFQTVWSYWLSTTIGNAGIVLGVVGYVETFVPELAASALLRFAVAQGMLWMLVALNVRGVRESARLQIAILFLNVVPLLLFSAFSLSAFDAANLKPFAPQGWSALPTGTALLVWAYAGIESATVPAEEVDVPERTIRRGTLIGYAIGTLVFLGTAIAVAGALPNDVIARSPRPIALAAAQASGRFGEVALSLAAIVAGVGTLNGWILMSGRIPVSAAEDGIFFEGLARLDARRGTPRAALLAGGAVSSAVLFLSLTQSLLGAFQFIVQLAVLTTLLPHLYTAAAELLLARREPGKYSPSERRRAHVVAPLAFVFVLFAMWGGGAEVAMWGFLAVFAGTPLYAVFATRKRSRVSRP